MSWISDEAACRQLVHEKAPALWVEIQDAIERDLEEYGKLFPEGPVSIIKCSREKDSLTVEFGVKESGIALHSFAVSVLIRFGFRGAGFGLAVVSTTWWGPHPSEMRALSNTEFEIRSCRDGAPLITVKNGEYDPQNVSRIILEGVLF